MFAQKLVGGFRGSAARTGSSHGALSNTSSSSCLRCAGQGAPSASSYSTAAFRRTHTGEKAERASLQHAVRSPSVRTLSSKTIKDPDHPTGIYFHPIKEQGRYAISFLSKPPSSPTSKSIIAYMQDVDDQTQPGEQVYDVARRKPDLVRDNDAFVALLHEVMRAKAVPQDGLLEYEAHLRKDGFAHVADPRHQLMPGRIPTPENIIGMVAFTDRTIRPETYEPNATYRLITHEEGFIQLRANWQDPILDKCAEVN